MRARSGVFVLLTTLWLLSPPCAAFFATAAAEDAPLYDDDHHDHGDEYDGSSGSGSASASSSSFGKTRPAPAPRPRTPYYGSPPAQPDYAFQVPINLDLNLTALKHHAGEAAVGAAAGTAVAWLLRRLQGMAVMVTVLGGIGATAALHLKWISPEQLRLFVGAALRLGRAKVDEATNHLDLDEDGELTFEDSRIAYSRVAPHVQKHTALTAGLVGGFLTAFGSLR